MSDAAVDVESYYDEDCSITTLGTEGYILHPSFHVYLVSICTDTGLEYVGDIAGAPWKEISGPNWEWLHHNASFDERVIYYLRLWKLIPEWAFPRVTHCTADLCAYSSAPRALANASSFLYNETVPKDYRNVMKGKLFVELTPENREKVMLAGITDARTCLRFWKDLGPKWPENERRISRISRQQAWNGVRLDVPALEADLQLLKTLKFEAEKLIPWNDSKDANLSYEALCRECVKVGIEAPASTAIGDEQCAAWEDKYGDQYPWIDAMRTSRRANTFLKKVELMYARVRKSDGRMPYANKYFGAHTGRWGDGGEKSGRNKEGGFNSRNLPRTEKFGEEYFLGKVKEDGTREIAEGKNFTHIWTPGMKGVNLRRRIIPADGHQFQIPDLSQIEPRVLWQIVGDFDSLDLVRQGQSPYEVHMRLTMGYTGGDPGVEGETDPAVATLYQLAKARVLALGYGAGWIKFIQMAPTYVSKEKCDEIFGAPVTEEQETAFMDYLKHCKIIDWIAMWNGAQGNRHLMNTYVNSWLIVTDFRSKNPKIASRKVPVGIWQHFQDVLEAAVGEDLQIELPSGRFLTYRKIEVEIDGIGKMARREIKGTIIKDGRPQRHRLYGGKLTENVIQAIARDVFAECMLRLDDAGHNVVLHAHDEAVNEVLTTVTKETIEEIMSQAPAWMPNLPVKSKCKTSAFYTK